MNREIKFRAWDNVNNQMLDVQELNFEDCFYGGYTTVRTTMYSDYFDIREIPIMQYTGLHDKNGKEIYEGDIVLLDCYSYEEPVLGGKFKVIYDDINGMWLLVDLENKDRSFTFGDIKSYYRTEIEVIGNIYDNSKLLGGTNGI